MARCVGCGSDCRNHCSRRKAHGWCANCRNASGSSECSLCVAEKAALMQKRKVAVQASRAAVASTNAPVYVPSQPIQVPPMQFPGQGKSLSAMDDDEQHDWLWKATEALKEVIQHRAVQSMTTEESKHLQVLEAILETLEQELNEFILPQPKDASHVDMLVSY